MTESEQQAWVNRPLRVTVHELCPFCKTLKEEVKARPVHMYTTETKYSCQDCFKGKS